MDHETNSHSGLPENAFRELRAGEEYVPVMRPDKTYPEVTAWSVIWGLVMAVLFSAATAYSGLKIGQVMEAGIPIAILAVGLSKFLKSKETLGQNVIIQSIGAAAGGVIGGAIFILPALYILDLSPSFYQLFLSSLLGGFLGILFLIPFRKYFVKEMHGKFPFPEATAATEIFMTGEKGGKQAVTLVCSVLIGGIADFIASFVGWWSDTISTRMFSYGDMLADKFKIVFKMQSLAMILGLGYIIGLQYTAVICAGSFLSNFALVPLFHEIGKHLTTPFGLTATKLISSMSAEEIYTSYVKPIGIGSIATAGAIGIIRSWKIIKNAVVLAFQGVFSSKQTGKKESRCQTDIRMPFVMMFIILTLLVTFLFFCGAVALTWKQALIGVALVFGISFLFTTVAANAIAIVGQNPASGMTLMALLVTSLVLNYIGLSGSRGIVSALMIGSVVATALAMSGTFITDLKIGYWLGTTPKKQETLKFLGTIVSAITIVGVIYVLNQVYGFKGPHALVAPQANAVAAVIQPLMSNVAAPWMLYFVGGVIAILTVMMKIPPLAFALGMYLPIELNTPLLVGGFLAWFVSTRSKDEQVNNARAGKGTLVASGFMAGGSILAVVGSMLKFFGIDLLNSTWQQTHGAEWVALAVFTLLCIYILWQSFKVDKE